MREFGNSRSLMRRLRLENGHVGMSGTRYASSRPSARKRGTRAGVGGMKWEENNSDMLESSEYRSLNIRRAKPIPPQRGIFFSQKMLEQLCHTNAGSGLQAGHLKRPSREGCEEATATESHRERGPAKRRTTNKKIDHIDHLYSPGPGEKLLRVRILLYSKLRSF